MLLILALIASKAWLISIQTSVIPSELYMKYIFFFFQLVILCVSCTDQQKNANLNPLPEEFSGHTFTLATDKPFESEIKGELKMIFDNDSTGRYRIVKGSDMLNSEFKWRIEGDSLKIYNIQLIVQKDDESKAKNDITSFLVVKERNGYLLNSTRRQLQLTSDELSLENIDYKNTFEIIELIIKCIAILLGDVGFILNSAGLGKTIQKYSLT